MDGGEIRYEDYTKYDGARKRAIKAWNAVGRIDILPDNASHIADLEIGDLNDASSNAYGWWLQFPGADLIRMNKARFDSKPTGAERTALIRRVMAHEMGHALGLGDHDVDKWHTTALMYYATHWPLDGPCRRILVPQDHDEDDSDLLW